MGLIQWENTNDPTLKSAQQANLGEGESFKFKNVLEDIFSSDPNSSDQEEIQKENDVKKIPKDKPISSSTWFSDYEAMKKVVHLYDEIHPFIYGMKGGLNNTGELTHSWSSTSKRERVEELRRLNPNVKIIPTIFRWENPKEKIMENIGMNGRADIRDKHIKIILNEIETFDYDGIDIDYEGMSCEKKEKFEEFIVLLSKELKKRNKILSVAVHPKTPNSKPKITVCKGSGKEILVDFRENWRGPMTHDYEFLAKHVDRLKIMAYELHPRKYHNPGPGPQAPNVWLKDIIKYSKRRVPSEKLYMAIPTYGYDWALNCKSPAKSVYHSDVQRIKALNPTIYQPTNINQILKDSKSESWGNLTRFTSVHENKVYEDPSLWYSTGGCDRVAFFMNRKAFEEKMKLLQRYEIGGFSFWQLISDNDPGISDYLELLVTNKLPKVEVATDLYDDEKRDEKNIADMPAAGLNTVSKKSVKTVVPKETTKNQVSFPKQTKAPVESAVKVNIAPSITNTKLDESISKKNLEPEPKKIEPKNLELANPQDLPTANPKPDPVNYPPLKEDIVYE
jgi:spore germination protein YaaH